VNIIEEKTPEETQETSKPSGTVETPEATKPQEEKKPVEEKAPEEAPKPVEEKKPEPEAKPKVEEKKEEVPPVEKKEEKKEEEVPTSLIDELLATAAEKEAKEAKKPEETTPTQAIDRTEIDIARAVYPKLDNNSPEYDRKFEEAVVKEYIFQWTKAGGSEGPTFREVASQLSSEEKAPEKKAEKEKETKKEEATTKAPSVPGPVAESSITAEKEEELKAAVRRGNKGAIVELLQARRKKTKEA